MSVVWLSWCVLAGCTRSEQLPRSVTHEKLPSGQHRYSIHGLYIRLGMPFHIPYEAYRDAIGSCSSLTVDVTNGTMEFVTEAPVDDLQACVNNMAEHGGVVPYWDELLVCANKSSAFTSNLYRLMVHTNLPWTDGRDWPWLWRTTNEGSSVTFTFYSATVHASNTTFLRDVVLQYHEGVCQLTHTGSVRWISHEAVQDDTQTWRTAPVRYAPGMTGYAALNRTIPRCRCHAHSALRVFDDRNEFIWEDHDSIRGVPFLWTCDLDNDGCDELIVYQVDHGAPSIMVFTR